MFQTFHRLVVSTSVAIALTSISAFSALAQEATAPMHGGDQMKKMHSGLNPVQMNFIHLFRYMI